MTPIRTSGLLPTSPAAPPSKTIVKAAQTLGNSFAQRFSAALAASPAKPPAPEPGGMITPPRRESATSASLTPPAATGGATYLPGVHDWMGNPVPDPSTYVPNTGPGSSFDPALRVVPLCQQIYERFGVYTIT